MRTNNPPVQLTFGRMREIDRYSQAFAFLGWAALPVTAILIGSIGTFIMWRLGIKASVAYPMGGIVADASSLYSSWRWAPAVFSALIAIWISVVGIRFIVEKVLRIRGVYRAWRNPADAAFDLLKLGIAMALMMCLTFWLTSLAEKTLPKSCWMLFPPSAIEDPNPMENLKTWVLTRGVQFVPMVLLTFVLATFLRANKRTLLPSRGLPWVLAANVVVFEVIYSISNRPVMQFFLLPYDEAVAGMMTAIQFAFGIITLLVLTGLFTFWKARKIVRPGPIVECNIALVGATDVGKTRFFGESLITLDKKLLRGFVVDLRSSDTFARNYKSHRKSWILSGTTLAQDYEFSLVKDREVVRFHWQDVPGGITMGYSAGSVEGSLEKEWTTALREANALCVFFDCTVLAKCSLEEYPDFGTLQRRARVFIFEAKRRNDYERPPIICIVGTKLDQIDKRQERHVRRELNKLAHECRLSIRDTGIHRGSVSVRLCSSMINMRKRSSIQKLSDSGDDQLPIDPIQFGCAETLFWIAARIIAGKSLGLDGPRAAILGKATPYGELQAEMEDFAK